MILFGEKIILRLGVGLACFCIAGEVLSICHAQESQTQEASLPGASPPNEFGHLFPKEMLHWKDQESQLSRGLLQGELLRKKLLSKDSKHVSYGQQICHAVAQFQRDSAADLQSRQSVSRFGMSLERFQAQLNGTEKLSAECFDAFNGRWFGRWGQAEVNHDWQTTTVFKQPRSYPGSSARVVALQYAWISNGFGWNYLVHSPSSDQSRETFPYVLGMVYYFDGVDFENIRGEKAHVGFVDSPTRLVWITEHEVFLEEVIPHESPEKSVYVITAIYHSLLDSNPSISNRATQAVYTRSPDDRPEFYEFNWRPPVTP